VPDVHFGASLPVPCTDATQYLLPFLCPKERVLEPDPVILGLYAQVDDL